MKKIMFKKQSCFCLGAVAAVMLSSLAACTDDAIKAGDSDSNADASTLIGAEVNIVTDQATLSQYVTNYLGGNSSRSSEDEDISNPHASDFTLLTMPDINEWKSLLSSATNIETVTADYNALDNSTTYKSTTTHSRQINFGGATTIIVESGTLTITNAWSCSTSTWDSTIPPYGATVYSVAKLVIMPGAKVVWNNNNLPLEVYNYGGTFEWSRTTTTYQIQNNTGAYYTTGDWVLPNLQVEANAKLYVGGTLSVVDDSYGYNSSAGDNGQSLNFKVTSGAKVQCGALETSSAEIQGNLTVETSLHTKYINFSGSSQYIACLYATERVFVSNNVSVTIDNYLTTPDLYLCAGGYINLYGHSVVDAKQVYLANQNGCGIVGQDDEYSTLICETIKMDSSNNDYTENFKGNFAFFCDEFINGGSHYEVKFADTVLKNPTESEYRQTARGCAPSINIPEEEDEDEDPEPEIIEIAHVEADHTHEISATCVYPFANTGKTYISWHKRGTSIHGCIEAMELYTEDGVEKARLTSWMETTDGTTEGGNNWNGNSSVEGAEKIDDVQGEYDFNHVTVAEQDGVKYIVTVGDHAKKGGFIGTIALNASGDFGQHDAASSALQVRQLLGNIEYNLARSGNCVVESNGKFLIACAGGFQEYTGKLGKLASYEYLTDENGHGLGYGWAYKLGDYRLTDGSAKHIAVSPNGQHVATVELNEYAKKIEELQDYWFNDIETQIPSTIALRSASSNWLEEKVWEVADVDIRPVYGKNVISVDNEGNIYVSAGIFGVQVYNNGSLINSWTLEDYYDGKVPSEYSDAAVNGLYVDDDYIYLAYGASGLWILDKDTMQPVCSNYRPDYLLTVDDTNGTYAKTKASANYVAVDSQGYIYVAWGRAGVRVLKLQK